MQKIIAFALALAIFATVFSYCHSIAKQSALPPAEPRNGIDFPRHGEDSIVEQQPIDRQNEESSNNTDSFFLVDQDSQELKSGSAAYWLNNSLHTIAANEQGYFQIPSTAKRFIVFAPGYLPMAISRSQHKAGKSNHTIPMPRVGTLKIIFEKPSAPAGNFAGLGLKYYPPEIGGGFTRVNWLGGPVLALPTRIDSLEAIAQITEVQVWIQENHSVLSSTPFELSPLFSWPNAMDFSVLNPPQLVHYPERSIVHWQTSLPTIRNSDANYEDLLSEESSISEVQLYELLESATNGTVEITAGEVSVLKFKETIGGSISGTLKIPDNISCDWSLISGEVVIKEVLRHPNGRLFGTATRNRFDVGPVGEFNFQGLAEGEYSVNAQIRCDNNLFFYSWNGELEQGEDKHLGELPLIGQESVLRVRVSVRDLDGRILNPNEIWENGQFPHREIFFRMASGGYEKFPFGTIDISPNQDLYLSGLPPGNWKFFLHDGQEGNPEVSDSALYQPLGTQASRVSLPHTTQLDFSIGVSTGKSVTFQIEGVPKGREQNYALLIMDPTSGKILHSAQLQNVGLQEGNIISELNLTDREIWLVVYEKRPGGPPTSIRGGFFQRYFSADDLHDTPIRIGLNDCPDIRGTIRKVGGEMPMPTTIGISISGINGTKFPTPISSWTVIQKDGTFFFPGIPEFAQVDLVNDWEVVEGDDPLVWDVLVVE